MIQTFTLSTFYKIQRYYLVPATSHVWKSMQEVLFRERTGEQLRLGGDGRCCSPGHTAAFGSYTLMDAVNSKVLDTQLVQVNSFALNSDIIFY